MLDITIVGNAGLAWLSLFGGDEDDTVRGS